MTHVFKNASLQKIWRVRLGWSGLELWFNQEGLSVSRFKISWQTHSCNWCKMQNQLGTAYINVQSSKIIMMSWQKSLAISSWFRKVYKGKFKFLINCIPGFIKKNVHWIRVHSEMVVNFGSNVMINEKTSLHLCHKYFYVPCLPEWAEMFLWWWFYSWSPLCRPPQYAALYKYVSTN